MDIAIVRVRLSHCTKFSERAAPKKRMQVYLLKHMLVYVMFNLCLNHKICRDTKLAIKWCLTTFFPLEKNHKTTLSLSSHTCLLKCWVNIPRDAANEHNGKKQTQISLIFELLSKICHFYEIFRQNKVNMLKIWIIYLYSGTLVNFLFTYCQNS